MKGVSVVKNPSKQYSFQFSKLSLTCLQAASLPVWAGLTYCALKSSGTLTVIVLLLLRAAQSPHGPLNWELQVLNYLCEMKERQVWTLSSAREAEYGPPGKKPTREAAALRMSPCATASATRNRMLHDFFSWVCTCFGTCSKWSSKQKNVPNPQRSCRY